MLGVHHDVSHTHWPWWGRNAKLHWVISITCREELTWTLALGNSAKILLREKVLREIHTKLGLSKLKNSVLHINLPKSILSLARQQSGMVTE